MRRTTAVISTAATLLGAALAAPILATPGFAAPPPPPAQGALKAATLNLARQPLAANDGWAASGAGTTGGGAADDAHVSVVHNRSELVAALGGDNATNIANATPKIVFIAGTIDANTDDTGKPLTCADYADPAYSLTAFLAAYDPAVWGKVNPTGALEDARVRSTNNQRARVMINVGSNTTIVGLPGARLIGGNLMIGDPKNSVSNVIVRNVTFEDAHDCFPAWSPTDGATGNWNSLYDNVSVIRGTNVWLDHNTFSDGTNGDENQPLYFGRPYQVHDGLSDITKGSDYVTVSYNVFKDHDKSMLIGSTNTPGDPATNPAADLGRLRVTLHHNLFSNLGQRLPRVRFGKVDVYNNLYQATNTDTFVYAWGAGFGSALYAENNAVVRSSGIAPSAFVYNWGGTAMTEKGTLVQVAGTATPPAAVSLLDAFNAANPTLALGTDAGWTPTLRTSLDPARAVPAKVRACAGAGKLPLR